MTTDHEEIERLQRELDKAHQELCGLQMQTLRESAERLRRFQQAVDTLEGMTPVVREAVALANEARACHISGWGGGYFISRERYEQIRTALLRLKEGR